MILLTADEAAELVGLAPRTLLAGARRGEVPHVKVGRLVRFNEAALRRWAEGYSDNGEEPRRRDVLSAEARAGQRPLGVIGDDARRPPSLAGQRRPRHRQGAARRADPAPRRTGSGHGPDTAWRLPRAVGD